MKINSLSTFAAYCDSQERLEKRSHISIPVPAITISRECGAGAVTVASIIADFYNTRNKGSAVSPWLVFDRNLAEKVLVEHKLPGPLAKYMPEDITPDLKAAFEEFIGLHPSTWTLVQNTNETMLRLAQAGHAIIVGRGGNIVTAKIPTVFHVRLVAPIEFRIQQIMQLMEIEYEDAHSHILNTDRARRRYLRRNFGEDIDDPSGYHITINTGRVSFAAAAKLIIRGTLHNLAASTRK